MKYLALLRGINVGGNSTVSMAVLKEVFVKAGFSNVVTYINSGNVIFESEQTNRSKLERQIEDFLQQTFFPIRTVVVSEHDLQHIVEQIPPLWEKDDVRKYVSFLKQPARPEDFLREVQPKEGVDFVDKGPDVVYLTTKMGGLTKSNFSKLNTKKIYPAMTMRNFNTVQKLFDLMQKTVHP